VRPATPLTDRSWVEQVHKGSASIIEAISPSSDGTGASAKRSPRLRLASISGYRAICATFAFWTVRSSVELA